MSDELKNADGFDDDGATAGDFIRVIQGTKWTYSNEAVWLDSEEEQIPPTREVVIIKVCRVLQKWINQAPVHDETRFLAPGEQVDIRELNEACPKTEWSEDLNGKPRGPWQIQHMAYAVDMGTMERITYPTGTVGGILCIEELKEAVKLMRQFRGPGVYPVVSPSNKWMNTRFGGRLRPHFAIKRWISFGPDGTTAALPSTSPPSLQAPASQQGPDSKAAADQHAKIQDDVLPSGAHVVEEPTLKEELNDKLPW